MKVIIHWAIFIAIIMNILSLILTGDAYLPE